VGVLEGYRVAGLGRSSHSGVRLCGIPDGRAARDLASNVGGTLWDGGDRPGGSRPGHAPGRPNGNLRAPLLVAWRVGRTNDARLQKSVPLSGPRSSSCTMYKALPEGLAEESLQEAGEMADRDRGVPKNCPRPRRERLTHEVPAEKT